MEEKIAVRVKTEEDARIVQENEFSRGNSWPASGNETIDDPCRTLGEQACIRITQGLAWAAAHYYRANGYEIISVIEYLKRFGTKKDKYVIKIKDRDKFDFDRIVKEVREADPEAAGFILTAHKGLAVVMLYTDFLRQFERNMATAAEETLSSGWGYTQAVSVGASGGLGGLCRTPWAASLVRGLCIDRVTVPAIIKEIDAAKALVGNPEIKINVRIL